MAKSTFTSLSSSSSKQFACLTSWQKCNDMDSYEKESLQELLSDLKLQKNEVQILQKFSNGLGGELCKFCAKYAHDIESCRLKQKV